uniref:CID domain-containing protein n=1 Tax=Leersia perrieri TaxID=77586 RepID=A0A0D9VU73_9ORYZ
MKGFPAWPAMISEPEQWGLTSVKKKLLVYFYGTKQIAFCNYTDLEAFTEEKRRSLLAKRQGKGSDFVRAVDEIIDVYDSLKEGNNKLGLVANEAKQGVEKLANNNSSLDTEGLVSSSNMGSDKKQDHSIVASGHNTIDSDEPSVTAVGSERCVVNSAPDDPTENVSILDEMRNIPLSTSSVSKKLRDEQPQNCYTRSRNTSLRRSRSSLNTDTRKSQDSGKLSGGTSLASVDLAADGNKEGSTHCVEDVKGNSGSPSTQDGFWLHSSAGITNKPGTPGTSNNNKKQDYTTKVDSNCDSEASQNGASEKEFRLHDTSSTPMKKSVIFKRKRKPNRNQFSYSTDKDDEFQAELSENIADSPNSKAEVNKSDGDEHLPLVKRARVRMGRPQLKDSPVDEVDVTNNIPELATLADQCNMNNNVAVPSDDCSIDQSAVVNSVSLVERVANSVSNPSSKLSMPASLVEGQSSWKNKEYQPKILTLDVEAALPPSKRLHRALEAMSANVAETNNLPEATGSKRLIPNGCVASENSHSNKSADTVVTSTNRSAMTESPRPSLCTESMHSPNLKTHSESILQNNTVSASPSVPSEAKDADSHIVIKGNICEEIHVDSKNIDCLLVSNEISNDVCGKGSSLSMKLNESVLGNTQTIAVPDRLSSSLGTASVTEVAKLINGNEGTKPVGHPACETDRSVERCDGPIYQSKLPSSDNIVTSLSILQNETVLAEPVVNVGDTASTSSLATKSSSIQSDADNRTFEVHTSALSLKELNHRNLKDKSTSPDSMPMKELIAVAQARRFSRSTSFPDNFLNAKYNPETVVDTPAFKEGSQKQLSPLNRIIRSTSTNDNIHSRSPFDSQQQKSLSKLTRHDEANAARKVFGAFLGTLTRTKENIARATRLAIECAKHGIAGEAIDIIVERLEKETNLYKRVDLFFLVDSITQYSRNQKGGAGDVYPSLIQAVLPRLLYAAAPPGNSAWENRRQCLKVLKLWLERKTLPEYIIHHHIRELDAINEASFGSSRRPSRTERALNDPLRDNEGMLVDEYGRSISSSSFLVFICSTIFHSNAGFQLPNLISTKVLEDDDGSSSEDRSFEAVTPEHDAPCTDEKDELQMQAEKHHRVLEEVDGELEMEDVAPPSEVEASTSGRSEQIDTKCRASDRHTSDNGPPLPDDRPPSPPPLPSSPPPVPPPPPAQITQTAQLQPTLPMASDPVGPHPPRATNNIQTQQPNCIAERPSGIPSVAPLQPPPFCNSGYGGHPNQMPPPPPIAPLNPPGPHGNFPVTPAPYHGNNYHQPPMASIPNEGYHLQPPPPPPPVNQYPYRPPEPQQRPRPWGNNSSSYPERHRYNGHDRDHHRHDRRHHGNDRRHHFDDRGYHYDDRGYHYDDRGHYFDDRGHHFDDRGRSFDERAMRGPMHHEVADRGRYPFPPGPPTSDHFEASSAAPVHYGRPSDPPPGPCSGWSMPPRSSNYSPSRHSMEPPVPHVGEAKADRP